MENLFRRIAEGLRNTDDEQAKPNLEQLVRVLHDQIQRYLLSTGMQPNDVEDILQETWMKVWQKRRSIDPAKRVRAWVFKIAVNSAYDLLRLRNRDLTFYKDELVREVIAGKRETVHVSDSMEEHEQIRRVFHTLNDREQRVLSAFCDAEGNDWISPELIKELDVKDASHIRVIKWRALKEMRQRLEQERQILISKES